MDEDLTTSAHNNIHKAARNVVNFLRDKTFEMSLDHVFSVRNNFLVTDDDTPDQSYYDSCIPATNSYNRHRDAYNGKKHYAHINIHLVKRSHL